MYSVRLYYNTGFNSINIPDTDGLLNGGAFASASFPSLDILQNTNLTSIRIKATFNQVKDADFCCIFTPGSTENTGAFYYFIDGVTMRSVDVAELSLVPDYITSAGGAISLNYTDGIARRAHVTDDTYGKWNLEDDYLTPSEPLQLETEMISFSAGGTSDVVESSIDVLAMAGLTVAWNYEDAAASEGVAVPRSVANFKTTGYQLDGNAGGDTRTTLFIIGDNVKSGIEQCRALGIERVILNTAYIPKALVTMTTEEEKIEEQQTIPASVVVTRGGQAVTNFIGGKLQTGTLTADAVVTATGNFVENQTGFAYEYNSAVKNKRVLYGGLNRVGILTTSGDKLESRPEDIRDGGTNVIIKSVGDPHTNGCAYHRFKAMNGDSSNIGFFKNAVKGLQWKQIPLIYTQKSGSALDRINFENSREVTDFEYQSSTSGIIYGGKGITDVDVTTGQATPHRGALFGGNQDIGLLGRLGAAASNLLLGPVMNPVQKYAMQRRQELQNFAIGQSCTSPDIQFAYDGEAFRDFYGECVIVYRYRPTAADLARLDKILTMYGYRVNVPISTGLFTGRDYFNYVEASVTVSGNNNGNLPRWWCEGISQQMAAGVRVWHVKPDPSYYNNNPIT